MCHKPGFKFVCPQAGCGWTFKRYISWYIHYQRWHPDSTSTEAEYRWFPSDTPSDPADLTSATPFGAEIPENPQALNTPLPPQSSTLADVAGNPGISNEDSSLADIEIPESPEAIYTLPAQSFATPRRLIRLTLCPPTPNKVNPSVIMIHKLTYGQAASTPVR